jgi:dienelactone hydrolase
LLLTLFLSALFLARARDPFHREWLSLKTPDGARFSAVVVMPDRGGPFPVVVWCHGAGGSAEGSGEVSRQFASLGLAAVGFEYDRTNQAGFDAQFAAVLEAVGKTKWSKENAVRHLPPALPPVEAEKVDAAKSSFAQGYGGQGGRVESGKEHRTLNLAPRTLNGEQRSPDALAVENLQPANFQPQPGPRMAWVGNSLGAQRQLSFLARHPERRPAALVRLNGGRVEELMTNAERGTRSAEQAAESGTGEATTKHTEHAKGGTENLQPATFNRQAGAAANHESQSVNRKSDGPTPDPSEEGNLEPATFNLQPATGLALRAWLAHGENDEVFPAADARAVAEWLRARGAEVQLDVFPGRGHSFGEDQPLLVRRAAEFCARELGANRIVPDHVRSSHWYYWLPVGVLGVVLVFGPRLGSHGRRGELVPSRAPGGLPGGRGLIPKASGAAASRWLWWSAGVAAVAAVLVSAAHLALPLLRANETTVRLARAWNVRPELRADFDWLVSQPGAPNCRLRDLLEHLNLAALQRGQFAASLPEHEWREYVVSPWIAGTDEDIAWRRELWETLQPRVRRETDAEQAAMTVARQICLRVRFMGEPARPANPRLVWRTGVGGREDFDRLYVAALRSVGIAARLTAMNLCELFRHGKWQPAPRPPIIPAAEGEVLPAP